MPHDGPMARPSLASPDACRLELMVVSPGVPGAPNHVRRLRHHVLIMLVDVAAVFLMMKHRSMHGFTCD